MSEFDYTEKPDLGELSPSQFFDYQNSPFDVEEHMLYSVVSGSKAYGMSTPTSDTDVRGVVVPPLKYFTGLNNFEQVENQSKDVCYYGLRKFVQLCYKNNVHALEMLYMHPDTVMYVHPVFQELLLKRDLFPSKAVGYSFGGYAWQQLMVMRTKVSNHTGRVELIEKFGYDTKMAAHALRLYRSGREFLETGVLQVKRPDAEELLEVRAGKYTFEEFVQFDKDPDNPKKWVVTGGVVKDESDRFKEAFESSNLPRVPDYNKVEALLMDLHMKVFKSRGWL